MFKKYLLTSTVAFAPPDEGSGGPDGDERIPEPTLDDDEAVTDPVDESETDDQDEDADVEASGEDDDEGGEQPPARQPRGDRQMGALRAQNRQLADEQARLTRQLDELRRNPPQQQVVETPQQRADRLALMSPEDRIQATVDEALQHHQQQTAQLQNQLMDQSDSAAFQSQTAINPLLKKLAPEVERRLADLRSRGQNLSRAVVATYLIGERVLAQQGKAKPAAQQRRRQQNARPVNAGGDVQGRRARQTGNTAADIEARFGDVPI